MLTLGNKESIYVKELGVYVALTNVKYMVGQVASLRRRGVPHSSLTVNLAVRAQCWSELYISKGSFYLR